MGVGVNLQWCTGKCANREWNCYKEFVRHNRVSLLIRVIPGIIATVFYNIHILRHSLRTFYDLPVKTSHKSLPWEHNNY